MLYLYLLSNKLNYYLQYIESPETQPQINGVYVETAFLKGPVSGRLKKIPGKKGGGEIFGEAEFFSVNKPLPKNLSEKEIDAALNKLDKAA